MIIVKLGVSVSLMEKSDSKLSLNTHFYDGKLEKPYQRLKAQINMDINVEIVPLDKTIAEITQYMADYTSLKTKSEINTALRMLQLFQSEKGNWDEANKIDARELLRFVWHRVRDFDPSAKSMFLEQLIDIQNGSCPQGRTTRLLQCVPYEK